MIKINSEFDGGNILCLQAEDPQNIRLEIKPDAHSEVLQWFYFRLSGAQDNACRLNLMNAAKATYPKGWEDYRAVASYDRRHWFRVPTEYDGQVLSIVHTPLQQSIYYAYFAPYSMERHADLIARSAQSARARTEVLGLTLDGQALDLLQIGDSAR